MKGCVGKLEEMFDAFGGRSPDAEAGRRTVRNVRSREPVRDFLSGSRWREVQLRMGSRLRGCVHCANRASRITRCAPIRSRAKHTRREVGTLAASGRRNRSSWWRDYSRRTGYSSPRRSSYFVECAENSPRFRRYAGWKRPGQINLRKRRMKCWAIVPCTVAR